MTHLNYGTDKSGVQVLTRNIVSLLGSSDGESAFVCSHSRPGEHVGLYDLMGALLLSRDPIDWFRHRRARRPWFDRRKVVGLDRDTAEGADRSSPHGDGSLGRVRVLFQKRRIRGRQRG